MLEQTNLELFQTTERKLPTNMHSTTLLGLAASITSTQALYQGFNYGATQSDGSTAMTYDDYQSRFSKAQNLPGTSGFTSARLYTMIQSGTTDTPSSAFQAAIDTQTSLLLGIWCSAGQEVVTNELNAFKSAIEQYGEDFTSLIAGISVGSEDLYRVSPTGIENDSGYGSTPNELVNYIKQTRQAIEGTALSSTTIGHVDTWTAFQNGSNAAVIEAIDWLGMDTYPYFQTTVENSIENANQTFWDAYDITAQSGNGKPIWITETGWPVSGKTSGQAVASKENAEIYWQEIACALLGNYNTWWYTLEDSIPTTPNPSFGIIGSDLDSEPLYDLKCKKQPPKPSSGPKRPHAPYAGGAANNTMPHGTASATGGATHSATGSPIASETGASATGGVGAGSGSDSGSGAASSSSGAAAPAATGGAARVESAVCAGILAIVGLVAAL